MANVTLTLSITALNVNSLNNSIRRQRLTKWIIQQDPTINKLQKTQLRFKDTYSLKVEGWERYVMQVVTC